MSLIVSFLLSPILVVLTIPLASFAALTSILAFSTLSVRVLIVYIDLAVVLMQDQLMSQGTKTSAKQVKSFSYYGQRPSLSHRRSGSSQGSSHTQLSGLGAYGNGSPTRDFEGIGGWRDSVADDEDVLWTQMNNRLQLPVHSESHQRHHHRSRTSSSLVGLPITSPSSTQMVLTPFKFHSGYPASPEAYFAHQKMSKSATSLDAAHMSRSMSRHKPSSSSGSSVASMRLSVPVKSES